ncbi:MFS transporter, partial [Roseibium sp. RKSG952]|uniref:MFS transporter n=1 Tax=Roseibium sp. RKSG952 TaxID=2529384 RepID=UPI0012BB8AE6
SWRWIFWINPPIVVLIATISIVTWRDVERPPRTAIDWLGLVLIAAGMFAVVFALMEAGALGWGNPVILGLFALGLALIYLFARLELAIPHPLIEVSLFKDLVVTACNLVSFLTQYSKMQLYIFAALYAQRELGFTAFEAGIIVFMAALLQPVISPVSGRFADRLPPRKLIFFGLSTMTISMLLLTTSVLLGNIYVLGGGLLIAGAAIPFLFIAPRMRVVSALPAYKHGEASSVIMAAQMIGGTVGLAVSSAVYAASGAFAPIFAVSALLGFLVLVFCLLAFRAEAIPAAEN